MIFVSLMGINGKLILPESPKRGTGIEPFTSKLSLPVWF